MTDSVFTCPVCHDNLYIDGKAYKCKNNHLYDISKFGYVNLLMSNKSSESHHGDDKNMVNARTKFLELGYYEKLRDLVCSLSLKYSKNNSNICDIGCGEGYYTSKIYETLKTNNILYHFSGIDISKDALSKASKRYKEIEFAVASAYKLPYSDKSQDLIINMFAPFSVDEYNRIAKDDSYMIRVFPDEKHLYDLKKAIYNNPYKNEIDSIDFNGFELIEDKNISYTIFLKDNEEITSLFYMTPYSYKTSREDIEKLSKLDSLNTIVDFRILVYKKI